MKAQAACSYLFDPRRVSNALDSLPNLGSKLPDPSLEGEPSTAFPRARRSPREIFRVLGNDHYEHLAQLLGTIDRCIAAGFDQPSLIRTRAWKSFSEMLAELHLASHFLALGFQVSGFDATKGNDSVPDLLASSGNTRLAIEVYTPRRWEGLGNYQDEFRDALKNLDTPFDYRCAITHDVIDRFNGGKVSEFHPGVLTKQLEQIEIDDYVSRGVAETLSQLCDGHTSVATVRLTALNLLTTITCEASTARGDLPSRSIASCGPTLSGFAPEHDFVDIVNRSVRKLGRGQATGVQGAIPFLVVDLSQANLDSELEHLVYQREFAQTLRSHFADLRGHGLVAFVRRFSWSDRPTTFWIRLAPGLGEEVGQLWGTPVVPP